MLTLFLMLGYPGSGKTTAAKLIAEQTGATHLWADKIRREMFHHKTDNPDYSTEENSQLYEHLNALTAELLAADNSVVFDTAFNYYADRQKLREVATAHNARTLIVWVITEKQTARERALKSSHTQDSRVLGNMGEDHFERLSIKLEEPRDNENTLVVDGNKITALTIQHALAGYIGDAQGPIS